MKNLSLDHVHYRSSNFNETKKFYVDIMEGVEMPKEKLGGNENLHIALGGVSLLFALSGKPIPEPVPAGQRLGAYHIAFLVKNCKKATAYYKSRGAKVAIAPKHYAKSIIASFLTAPDGMLIELKEIIVRKKRK